MSKRKKDPVKVPSKPKPTDQAAKMEAMRAPYEAPAVIYTGKITTRAGTQPLGLPDDIDGLDPGDLFGISWR